MDDNNSHDRIGRTNRRQLLKTIGVGAIGGAIFPVSVATAQEQTQTDKAKKSIHNFDPSDQSEVKKATKHLLEIETKNKAEKSLSSLSPEREHALLRTIKSMNMEVERGEQIVNQPSDLPDRYSTSEITAASGKTYSCRVKLKSSVGTTEAIFDHYVHWNYAGSSISNLSHYVHVETPGWLVYYNGLTTNYLDVRQGASAEYGVSKMAGNFDACVTKVGCYADKIAGSTIFVYVTGNGACRPYV
jgi:uncharacterized protein (DUF2147 family)